MNSKGRIGLIIPHILGNSDVDLVDIIHRISAENGYDTIVICSIVNYNDDVLEYHYAKGQTNIYDIILHGDFDGFIFEANIFSGDKQRKIIIDLLRKRNKPCVIINYEQPYFPVVSADESIQLEMTTEHLIKEHNCRKLYCIGGCKGHIPSEERINGFRIAMDKAGLEYDESCIFYGNYWRDIPQQIAVDIAEGKLEKPDGIVCGSDIMAIALSRTLMEKGIKVPQDIKITGCDGSVTTLTERVTITTVSSQPKVNGMLAIRKLLGMLGNEINDNSIPLDLVIGESCGCCCNDNEHSKQTLADIREYAGIIFETQEQRRTSVHSEMNSRMGNAKNIYDVLGIFLGCCYMFPMTLKEELAICEDWCRNLDNPLLYRKGGYSDKMTLLAEYSQGDSNTMIEYNIRDIFPSLAIPHEPRLTLISSIHYKGQIFGYIGFTYKKAVHIVLDEFYLNWCDAISYGLNTVQNKMYKEYINKRIESLSEFAPVLGIYNKRGFITKMIGLMAEDSNSEYMLIVMSYIKEGRVKYTVPPINSIVNAIHLSDDRFILASIEEEIIAVVIKAEDEQFSSNKLAQEISEKVKASYKGAIDLKAELIVLLSTKISSADVFRIDSLICDMTDELKGKMLSLSSGMFSYKDSFASLRDEIFKNPEKDWNIEALARRMDISRSHFQRLYKEIFEVSCKEDIITARIDKAKWLLENTIIPVTQVSEQCGYFNGSHFIRQFGTRVDMTPSDYRRKYGKK